MAFLKKRIRNTDSKQAFPIGELITALTKELREAHARAEEEETKATQMKLRAPETLQVNGATIELAVQLERDGEGGVSFKVFGIGAGISGGLRHANTTTMTVHLGTGPVGAGEKLIGWSVLGPPGKIVDPTGRAVGETVLDS